MKKTDTFFDSDFDPMEQFPRKFSVDFESIIVGSKTKTRVSINGIQSGDLIDDNSKEKDGYRFHDVFHYTYAALLGWSPCTRSLMKRKRKSVPLIDETEDGARATITEEAISLMVFNKARKRRLFEDQTRLEESLLDEIKEMTSPFEVSIKSKKDWEKAILKGYSLFRDLCSNNGGRVHYDMIEGTAQFERRNV
ncbi:MAG: hypothetical protein RLN88_11385 [Ekhidna sp.]|uniref:hypothetical protein n=1 Tax=Ekhidna sp. TaxID=2608089 RepID=UPI0032EF59E9